MRVSPEDWSRISALFDEALGLPMEERTAFLAEVCEGRPDLRAHVEALLEADERGATLLGASPVALFEAVLDDTGSPPPPPAPPDDLPPDGRVGPYRLIRELGRGGMGTVWLADRSDGQFDREVAIKLIATGPDSHELRTRFLHERQVLASLEHPGIARLYDGGIDDRGRPYLVMERVRGRRIDLWADGRNLDVRERLELFGQVCDAVHYAHRNLVVHRDLKPSNILVTDERRVKLLDFGIAKLLEGGASGESPATRTATRLMTPEYASPEQLAGRPVTTASDVFGLGVVLYEFLTGHRPFDHGSTARRFVPDPTSRTRPPRPSKAVMKPVEKPRGNGGTDAVPALEIARARGASPERLAKRLRGDLDNIVLKALSEEPERRYPSADALGQDIRRHLMGHPVEARPASAAYQLAKFAQRHRAGVAAAALVVLSLAVGLASTAWQARRATLERDVALAATTFLEDLFTASDPFEAEGQRIDTLSLRGVVDRGAERVRTDLTGQPLVQARLMTVLGTVYRNLGAYDQGAGLLEEALEIRRRILGPRHQDVGETLLELGEVVRRAGDLERAEPLLREGLSIRRASLSFDDPQLAAALTYLGNTLLAKADLDGAESAYLEALEIRRGLGPGHADLGQALGNLGAMYQQRGDFATARGYLEEALAINRASRGEEHPATALSMNSLAVVLLDLEEFEAAEPIARRAAQLRRELLGDHPDVATALNNLAQILWYQRTPAKVAEAEVLFLESLAIRRATLGEGHPNLGVALNNLAAFYADQGRHDVAITTQQEAVELMRRALGPDHVAVGMFVANLGSRFRESGDPAGALSPLRDGIDVLERALPANHHSLANARYTLGLTLRDLERHAAAEAPFLAALEAFRSTQHPRSPDVLRDIIDLYEALQRPADAERFRAMLPVSKADAG